MKRIEDLKEIQDSVSRLRSQGKVIGVVPTMGALHAGHLSLVESARKRCDTVVTTIFLNPTQFSPTEDLTRYPRTLDTDLEQLEMAGNDIVFCPSLDSMYPSGFSTYVDPPDVALVLEGEKRPTHFRGVATVVLKLFQLIPSQFAFFGQKDFQQTCVIRQMVRDLNLPVEIVVCPIIRADDGLALSSRNVYLSADERRRALSIPRALAAIESKYGKQKAEIDLEGIRKELAQSVDNLEYLEIRDSMTLKHPDESTTELVVLIAAQVGETRLIDNLLIGLNCE